MHPPHFEQSGIDVQHYYGRQNRKTHSWSCDDPPQFTFHDYKLIMQDFVISFISVSSFYMIDKQSRHVK